jgi:hypothetical protein
MRDSNGSHGNNRWLLLIHQLPPKPAYLRVKIARRLLRSGAIAIKNTVYVLPNNEQSREDFQWLVQEIVRGGGEALVCEARLVVGSGTAISKTSSTAPATPTIWRSPEKPAARAELRG